MPLKLYRTEDEKRLSIGRVLYAQSFGLTVDRDLCTGCDICMVVCPREAITLRPNPKDANGKAIAPVVDVDVEKCDYHGECAAACPFGAIKVTVNGEEKIPVVEKEVYPEFIRQIEIDSENCEPECKLCEEKCPLNVVTVRFEPLTPEEVKEKKIKVEPGATLQRTIVDVKIENCACCKVCEAICPVNVIKVTKFINGYIKIYQERCPEGCQDCLDVCPVDALYLGEDGKIYVNDMFCIYCNACVNVCPKPEALEVTRTSIHHTPIKSGAWNKALENLTSVEGVNREFKAKRSAKAMEALKNLQL